MKREYYIDNLRFMAVLLLFPYHTFMIYNSYGESFYIKGADIEVTTGFLAATWPWFMPLLFCIAGISSAFALKKRTPGEYLKERVKKLFIPFTVGMLVLVPAQTFYAQKFHFGFKGSLWQQYGIFFSKYTDFTGYDGGFTTGHLWFLLYLFIISVAALPITMYFGKDRKTSAAAGCKPVCLPAMFLFPLAGTLILNIGGKAVGEYFACFLLGYFVLSKSRVMEEIQKYRFLLVAVTALSMTAILLYWKGFFDIPDIAYDVFSRFYAWMTILMLLAMGKRYGNFRNRVTAYLSESSFMIYLLHQTILVAVAYYVFQWIRQPMIQMLLIIAGSVTATFGIYELLKRIIRYS